MVIDGAIFDLDGTLLDSMPVWRRLGEEYLTGRGIAPPADINQQLRAMSLQQAAFYLKTSFALPESTDEIVLAVNKRIADFYRYTVPAKPGARAFLQALQKRGTILYVATASDRPQTEAALLRNGLLPYFAGIVTCTEVGAGKNSPLIYLKALEQMGTPKETTYVFEDSLHAALTAKSAGFRVVGVYDPLEAEPAQLQELADYYLPSFTETKELMT